MGPVHNWLCSWISLVPTRTSRGVAGAARRQDARTVLVVAAPGVHPDELVTVDAVGLRSRRCAAWADAGSVRHNTLTRADEASRLCMFENGNYRRLATRTDKAGWPDWDARAQRRSGLPGRAGEYRRGRRRRAQGPGCHESSVQCRNIVCFWNQQSIASANCDCRDAVNIVLSVAAAQESHTWDKNSVSRRKKKGGG